VEFLDRIINSTLLLGTGFVLVALGCLLDIPYAGVLPDYARFLIGNVRRDSIVLESEVFCVVYFYVCCMCRLI